MNNFNGAVGVASASSNKENIMNFQKDHDNNTMEIQRNNNRPSSSFVVRQLSAENGFPRTNDEVHSRITFCPVIEAVLATKVLQRLRYLKQTGTAESVYMNANHVRFEHSMGVAKTAEDAIREIRDKQEQLGITEKDILCIKLAGLCHDLGHGPYSHVYDNVFLPMIRTRYEQNPEIRKEYEKTFGKDLEDVPGKDDWEHEDASLMMIDAFLAELGLEIDMDNLDEPLKQIGNGVDRYSMRVFRNYEPAVSEGKLLSMDKILTSRDFVFIKECIIGKPLNMPDKTSKIAPDKSGFTGRPSRTQEFLYDIVSNRHNGLDVDKIDYFARDERRAMRSAGEIESRMVKDGIVAWGECPRPEKCFRCHSANPGKHLMLCYPEKMISEASKFFDKRFELHKKIYQHKTSIGVSILVCDILATADPYFKIPTFVEESDESFSAAAILKDDNVPRNVPISRAMLHKGSFLRLRDDVISQIMYTTCPELKEARRLCWRYQSRDIYKCPVRRNLDLWEGDSVKHLVDKEIACLKDEEIKEELLKLNGKHKGEDGKDVYLERDDIVVVKNEYNHGAKCANPLPRMRFVEKKDLSKSCNPVDELPEAFAPNVAEHRALIPQAFSHEEVLVYCRGSSEKCDLTKHVFEQWVKHLESQYEFPGMTTTTDQETNEIHQCTQESISTPRRSPQQYHEIGENDGAFILDERSPVTFAAQPDDRKRRKLVFQMDSP